MLCGICGKNPATVHLTEIIDDQMNELHLCEECARKKSEQMETKFGLNDLLAGIANFEKPALDKKAETIECPNCKLSYADFRKLGRLGCGECYTAFKQYLGSLIKRIHSSNQHIGKTLATAGKAPKKKEDLSDLRLRLQKAISEEAFEEAARIRDQIKEREKKEAS